MRRFLLIDDPGGVVVSTSEGSRPARPGEAYGFDELAGALTRHTGLPAEVLREVPGAAGPAAVVIVPADQLGRVAAAGRTAVVGVDRTAVRHTLERPGVVVVVERQQYWKWRTGGRADAAVCTDLGVVAHLRREVTTTAFDGGRLGRVRIDGDDLPGLLADVLTA